MTIEPIPDEEIVGYLPLVQSIALKVWRTAPQALDLDEVMSIAFEGLCIAADRYPYYCAENGFKVSHEGFGAYIKKRSHGAIIDWMRANDIASREERGNYKLLVQAGLLDGATEQELIKRTHIPVRNIRLAVKYCSLYVRSIDEQEDDNTNRPQFPEHQKARYQPASAQNVAREAHENALCIVVVDVIATLPKLQQVLLALHYVEGMEFGEAAKLIGINESRASREHTEAVIAVRQALADALLDDFTA